MYILQVDIPVYISNGDSHMISFGGIGYDLHQAPDHLVDDSMKDVLSKQLIFVPGQVSFISLLLFFV